ncbi:MAG: glycosyltransferase family 4 protein [Methylococcales bacterium]
MALFVGIARNSYLWLQRQLRGFLFWFRPTFSTVSLQEIAKVFGRTSSYYFELEERLYSGTRTTRILTLGQLCFWAIACLLFGIAYWPWSLMSRLCLRGSDKKRILLVSHESRMNGAPAGLVTIFESLDRDEFETYLLSASEGLLTQRARAADIPTFVLPLSQFLTQLPSFPGLLIALIRMAINFPFLLYLLVTLRITVVQTNVLVTPDTAITAKTLGIISIWHFREFIKNNFWAIFQVQVMNLFSDRILCNSEYSRNVINQKGIFWPKMVIVHDVLDQKHIKHSNTGSQFRKSLRLDEKDLLIGCVGQITQVKGQEIFVKAAIEIAREHPNVHFAIIGTLENSDYVEMLRELIHRSGLDECFTFTGFRTDIYNIMAALDIHVTPSIWAEPFGRVALETMGTGVVSVVSSIGGLREIVEHEISGIQFPPGDVQALQEVLSRLITDTEYRNRLSKNGIKRARKLFSVEKQTDILQQTYRYPKHFVSRFSHLRIWIVLQKYLPGRLRPHPRLLIYYPILAAGVVVLWLVGLAGFFCALPIAVVRGKTKRRRRAKKHVAVLAYQTNRNASTRHRITRLFQYIPENLATIRIFYPSSDWLADKVYVALFYGDAPHIRDFYFYVIVFLNRLVAILRCYSYHTVIIQYELFHEGPMWMELLVASTHPGVIYDYDDSLYVFPRYKRRLPMLLGRVKHVVVGNRFIAEYTRRFNSNITYIPTCPDLALSPWKSKPVDGKHSREPVHIGWAGNPASLFYLPMVTNAIRRLDDEYTIRFVIISSGPYDTAWLDLYDLPIKRTEWSLTREISDIQSLDIGVMPVIDDELGRGKCGFKALQYMAAGVPCVISPVGVNAAIVEHAVTGFFATSEEEWYHTLKQLIESAELRASIARSAFEYVRENFDMRNWSRVWENLLSVQDAVLPNSTQLNESSMKQSAFEVRDRISMSAVRANDPPI